MEPMGTDPGPGREHEQLIQPPAPGDDANSIDDGVSAWERVFAEEEAAALERLAASDRPASGGIAPPAVVEPAEGTPAEPEDGVKAGAEVEAGPSEALAADIEAAGTTGDALAADAEHEVEVEAEPTAG